MQFEPLFTGVWCSIPARSGHEHVGLSSLTRRRASYFGGGVWSIRHTSSLFDKEPTFLFKVCSELSVKRSFVASVTAALAFGLISAVSPIERPAISAPRIMSLPSREKATSKSDTILRNSLPYDKPEYLRNLENYLEDMRYKLRLPRGKYDAVKSSATSALRVLENDRDNFVSIISKKDSQSKAAELIASIRIDILRILEAAAYQDGETVFLSVQSALDKLLVYEDLLVRAFPFKVPKSFETLPQLKGRATVEMTVERRNGATATFQIVCDGYNAPINAGHFVSLVKEGAFNGTKWEAFESEAILQSGEPKRRVNARTVPLEVKVKDDVVPYYAKTLDDYGLDDNEKDLSLPFSAYGAVAMSRPQSDVNGATGRFFIYLYDGNFFRARLLDGNYSVFGYVVDGKDVLATLADGDVIKTAKVIKGLDTLQLPRGGGATQSSDDVPSAELDG